MYLFDKFSQALPYAEFMARHGTPAYDARWRATYDQVTELIRRVKSGG